MSTNLPESLTQRSVDYSPDFKDIIGLQASQTLDIENMGIVLAKEGCQCSDFQERSETNARLRRSSQVL